MANIVKLFFSKITGRVPATLLDGQIAINQKDKKLFYPNELGVIQTFSLVPPTGTVSIVETEVDFGTDPISSKTFTIVDGTVTIASDILPFTSPNPATGRIGNDWELDMPFMTALAQTGTILLTISFNHLVVGKRKIYYQIIN